MRKPAGPLRRMNGVAMQDHLALIREVQSLRAAVRQLESKPSLLLESDQFRLLRAGDGRVWLCAADGEAMELNPDTYGRWLARLFAEEF